jgi:hypothetical protein
LKEIYPSSACDLRAKLLISLKKIYKDTLQQVDFLIQCKKVQLSGEKCPLLQFSTEKGLSRVSRGFIAESGCQGAAVCADPAP